MNETNATSSEGRFVVYSKWQGPDHEKEFEMVEWKPTKEEAFARAMELNQWTPSWPQGLIGYFVAVDLSSGADHEPDPTTPMVRPVPPDYEPSKLEPHIAKRLAVVERGYMDWRVLPPQDVHGFQAA